MTHIEIDAATLTVQVQGLDKLWAFKSELRIPLSHISGAAPAVDEAFYEREGRVFWDVCQPERAIAMALHDDRYAKLVIEVEDPAGEIAHFAMALAERLTIAN